MGRLAVDGCVRLPHVQRETVGALLKVRRCLGGWDCRLTVGGWVTAEASVPEHRRLVHLFSKPCERRRGRRETHAQPDPDQSTRKSSFSLVQGSATTESSEKGGGWTVESSAVAAGATLLVSGAYKS